jgi:C1A family cysteine protease
MIGANNPIGMMEAVAKGPIAVGLAASSADFILYSRGVVTGNSCGLGVNHAVTIVGYGTSSDGIPYWLVKNSYGASWGDSGYIKIKRDTQNGSPGVCGINSSYNVLPYV